MNERREARERFGWTKGSQRLRGEAGGGRRMVA